MVDTVYITIPERKRSIDKSEMMMLDMLSNFDWKRPICFTQVYILQDFGLLDYLQYDGYSYRLVPIYTPYHSSWEIGRIDSEQTYPLMMETLRFGNLADEKVNADFFTQYNLTASKAREGYARVAKQLIREGKDKEAKQLLDRGMELLPSPKIRYTDANTVPFIEAYYSINETEAADKLLKSYAETLIEGIEYYLQFDEAKAVLVSGQITDRMDSLSELYYLAAYSKRDELLKFFNDYYRTFGYTDDELIMPGTDPAKLLDSEQIE